MERIHIFPAIKEFSKRAFKMPEISRRVAGGVPHVAA